MNKELFIRLSAILLTVIVSKTVCSQHFGTIIQSIPAKDLQNKEIKLTANVKAEVNGKGNQAQLWLRVDCEDKTVGFFDNMGARPITANKWSKYEITGKVNENAKTIVFGGFLNGSGKIWLDDFELYVQNDNKEWTLLPIANPGFEEIKADSSAAAWLSPNPRYEFKIDATTKSSGNHSLCITNKKFTYAPLDYSPSDTTIIALPIPAFTGNNSVESALKNRRSIRNYKTDSLTLQEILQLLWAAYGPSDTTKNGFVKLTAPSAGATYPLDIYLIAGNVNGLITGVYKYHPKQHAIQLYIKGDARKELDDATYSQMMVDHAPITIFYAATYERTTQRYGNRGRERYVCMDLGHSAQNVYLQATAMNMGTCAIGAFEDDMVSKILHLPKHQEPLYFMPVGKINQNKK